MESLRKFDVSSVSPRLLIAAGGGLSAVLLVFILLIVFGDEGQQESLVKEDLSNYPAVDEIWITAGIDFPIIPEEIKIKVDQDFYFKKPGKQQWLPDETAVYWIPVEEIGKDILDRENQKILDRIFEGIP